jgi:hypothetical protein
LKSRFISLRLRDETISETRYSNRVKAMRLDSRRVIAPIVFTLTVFTLVGYQKYRDPSFLSRASSLVRRRDAFVSVRPQDGGDGFPESPATERRSKPSVSGDLCEELVHSSRDHLRSIELLTRAQFPSAAREDEPDDSLNASASERFQCDDSGTTASSPKQLLDVFLFGGGEVDTLEIRLYELHDVVDAFIAVTSNVTHKGEPAFDALGPLLQTKRFERFRDKVKIFEYGQTGVAAPEAVNFQFEAEKERAVASYLAEKYHNETLVIFGHVDEIPAREDAWKLANCAGRALPGNFGIWFPYGNMDYAFRSDFPARNKPWTLGDPGATTAHGLKDMGLPRGRFENVLGRGFHATNYCFPPQYLLKMMTATEYSGFDAMIDDMRKALGENTTCAQFMQRIRDRCLNSPLKSLGSRMRRVSDLVSSGESAEQFYVPRALQIGNYTRYPSWDPSGSAVDWRTTASVPSPE